MVRFMSGIQRISQLNSMITPGNHVLANTELIVFVSAKSRIGISEHKLCRI